MENIESNNEEPSKEEVSKPPPKKRGRKRKCDMVETTPVAVTYSPVEMETSRSGRKRKKMNYFDLEKDNYSDASDTNVKTETNFKETNLQDNSFFNENEKNNLRSSSTTLFDSSANKIEKNLSNTISMEERPVKKRGRPKKNREIITSTFDLSTNNEKDIDEENKEKNLSNTIFLEERLAKKGERPKKNIELITSTFDLSTNNEENIDEENKEKNLSNTISLKERPVKKRGRPKKNREIINSTFDLTTNNEENINEANEEQNLINSVSLEKKTVKKRGRKHKNGGVTSSLIDSINNKNYIVEKNENSLEKRNEEMLIENQNDKESKSDLIKGAVVCAVCEKEVVKNKWAHHKQRFHNNLAWRVGDPPMDLKDHNFVVSVLSILYKAKKPLHCDKCGATKKSVIGFLSHQSQCGVDKNDVMVKCERCDKKVLPVSMSTHIKMVHESPSIEKLQKKLQSLKSDSLLHDKRSAAKKAMEMIDKISRVKGSAEGNKYFSEQTDFLEEHFVQLLIQREFANSELLKCKFLNCEFETNANKEFLEHLNSCKNKPEQYFTCKKCLFISETETEIKSHLKSEHEIEVIDDNFKYFDSDEEDDDDEKRLLIRGEFKKKNLADMRKSENFKVKPLFLWNVSNEKSGLFSHARQFSLEFCDEHFSIPKLFDQLHCKSKDWLLLDEELIENYLPKNEESCSFLQKEVKNVNGVSSMESNLQNLQLFESVQHNKGFTIFCGGSVTALSWMPLPQEETNANQILALSVNNDFNAKCLVNENYFEPTLIQFWNFGVLRNRESQNLNIPSMLFCLAVDFGPIWHIEWCPSGVFECNETDNEDEYAMKRMGIVAVAGSDGGVHVYSIPHLKELHRGGIFKVNPLLKLVPSLESTCLLGKEKFYATKVSWSNSKGHRHIAVGYSDGMVALFDLETESKLLKQKSKDNIDILLPYKCFHAHSFYISALHLIPISGGNRFLFTGSFDRETSVWDLRDETKCSSKKQIVSDGVWLNNWLAYVTSSDETTNTSRNGIHTTLKAYRDYLYEGIHLTNCQCTIRCISSSMWLNGFVHGSTVGEVLAVFPRQLMYNLDTHRFNPYKYLLSYVQLINKVQPDKNICIEEKEVENIPLMYEECKKKYGLAFCDINIGNTPQSYKKFQEKKLRSTEVSKANFYALQAVNKIAFNPNMNASLYYAAGYQAGFLKLGYLQIFENDQQI